MGFLPGGSDTTIRQHTNNTSDKITHHTQTKQSTQNCRSNKGHTTHKEYNENMICTTTYTKQ
jgi:hypothetical protein